MLEKPLAKKIESEQRKVRHIFSDGEQMVYYCMLQYLVIHKHPLPLKSQTIMLYRWFHNWCLSINHTSGTPKENHIHLIFPVSSYLEN